MSSSVIPQHTTDISLKPLPASLVFVRNCGSHLFSAVVLLRRYAPSFFRTLKASTNFSEMEFRAHRWNLAS